MLAIDGQPCRGLWRIAVIGLGMASYEPFYLADFGRSRIAAIIIVGLVSKGHWQLGLVEHASL